MPISHESPQEGFNIDAYLTTRENRENFVIVELGHNGVPIARKQHDLTGGRAYIGIEAWIRDRKHDHYKQHLGDAALKNVFFLDQYLYPKMEHAINRASHDAETYNEKGYDPTTILPNGAADELFLSNVFGDPHIHSDSDRPPLLLREAKRLLAPNGTLVIRETFTPHFPSRPEILADAGLKIVHRQNHGDSRGIWGDLEGAYNGGNKWALVEPTSFYLFIQHVDTLQTAPFE